MDNGLVRVRMLRHVAQFRQVLELEMGQIYELTPETAQQFVINGMADRVSGREAAEYEAAAAGPARKRG